MKVQLASTRLSAARALFTGAPSRCAGSLREGHRAPFGAAVRGRSLVHPPASRGPSERDVAPPSERPCGGAHWCTLPLRGVPPGGTSRPLRSGRAGALIGAPSRFAGSLREGHRAPFGAAVRGRSLVHPPASRGPSERDVAPPSERPCGGAHWCTLPLRGVPPGGTSRPLRSGRAGALIGAPSRFAGSLREGRRAPFGAAVRGRSLVHPPASRGPSGRDIAPPSERPCGGAHWCTLPLRGVPPGGTSRPLRSGRAGALIGAPSRFAGSLREGRRAPFGAAVRGRSLVHPPASRGPSGRDIAPPSERPCGGAHWCTLPLRGVPPGGTSRPLRSGRAGALIGAPSRFAGSLREGRRAPFGAAVRGRSLVHPPASRGPSGRDIAPPSERPCGGAHWCTLPLRGVPPRGTSRPLRSGRAGALIGAPSRFAGSLREGHRAPFGVAVRGRSLVHPPASRGPSGRDVAPPSERPCGGAHASSRARMSTMRSAALPSHRAGRRPRLLRPRIASCAAGITAAGS